jgi:hypothetical protein
MTHVLARLLRVRERIAEAAHRAGRPPDAVALIAVSKRFPAADVLAAHAAGQPRFGESQIQEAAAKIPAVAASATGVHGALEWHMIGQLQRNKARRATELFDLIHSVDRLDLGEALSRHAAARGRRQQVLLQVNIDAEPQKAGVAPEAAEALLGALAALPGLEVRGLMAIPRARETAEAVRPSFAALRELARRLATRAGPSVRLSELSMGMSSDYEVAVAEGATLVRVGTAIFGERPGR